MQERPCHILGSLCTPHDIWGTAYFGSCIETGDVLMIPTQGAYTYSLRQHFIKPLPKVVSLPARPTDIDA
jgi:diaminopimelate decarboxylase